MIPFLESLCEDSLYSQLARSLGVLLTQRVSHRTVRNLKKVKEKVQQSVLQKPSLKQLVAYLILKMALKKANNLQHTKSFFV